ncbi:ATP-binding cassette domain-containing protein [Arthrobacter alpinus]|uniref:ATP-binding cassette domain-containing protein n=1 Tax=Arthrobacter alpinus TaxID=656366 RepID=UPI0028F71132|nr:ATP-binding cassette domain-containing protein [Arthrobacter alpinus]
MNLPVERGKIFGRLGSNGAGKTTTLKDIEGVLKLKSSILLPPIPWRTIRRSWRSPTVRSPWKAPSPA